MKHYDSHEEAQEAVPWLEAMLFRLADGYREKWTGNGVKVWSSMKELAEATGQNADEIAGNSIREPGAFLLLESPVKGDDTVVTGDLYDCKIEYERLGALLRGQKPMKEVQK